MWHGFSWKFHVFHVTNRREVGPNWHQIPWLFHVIYPRFICFPYAQTWHGFWTSSIHGISMAFGKEMIHRISSDLVIFNQTAIKKTRNSVSLFCRDGMIYFYIVNLLFRMEYDSLKSCIMFFNFTFHKGIKALAQMVRANSMCCGQGIRLVGNP